MGIIVEAPTEGRKVTVERDFGPTVAEKVERYSEEVCNSALNSIFAIKMQAIVRARLKAVDAAGNPKYTDEEAIQAGLSYVPQKTSARGAKKDPLDVLAEQVAKGEISKKELMDEIAERIRLLGSEPK